MNRNYKFDIAYLDNSQSCVDAGWNWTTPDELEHDLGLIYDTFVRYLRLENRLKKMRRFKIIGLVNVLPMKAD